MPAPVMLMSESAKKQKKAQKFQFGGYVSGATSSSANTSSLDPGSNPNENFLIEEPQNNSNDSSSGEIKRYVDQIVHEQGFQPHHPLISTNRVVPEFASSPDSVRNAF